MSTTGTAKNDTLVGTEASELYLGRGGNDDLTFGWGADTVFAGDGDDELYWRLPFIRDENLFYINDFRVDQVDGGSGDDSLVIAMGHLDLGTVKFAARPNGGLNFVMDGNTAAVLTGIEALLVFMPDNAS